MTSTSRRRLVPRLPGLRPRDPSEAHRVASPLELFFDVLSEDGAGVRPFA